MGLLTTTVGSFPKPAALKRARHRLREREIDRAALQHEESKALAEVISFQERAGLSILTDGEMTRGDLVGHYAGRLQGVEEGLLVRCWGNRYVRRPRVTGPIESTGPLVLDRWDEARKLTRRPLRATVTGPYTLMHWSFDEYYGSRRECTEAFATVIAAEVAALAAAGADEIQLDEPALGAIPEETPWAARILGDIASQRGSARLWAYVAFGDPEPDWNALAGLPVDCLMIGAAHRVLSSADGLDALAEHTTVVAGVVDSIETTLETTEEIRERIERVLSRVPSGRLMLAPDAGLRGLPRALAEAKVLRLVEAAAGF